MSTDYHTHLRPLIIIIVISIFDISSNLKSNSSFSIALIVQRERGEERRERERHPGVLIKHRKENSNIQKNNTFLHNKCMFISIFILICGICPSLDTTYSLFLVKCNLNLPIPVYIMK